MTVGTYLPELAGNQVVAFVLVLGRIAPLFLLAPVLSAPLLATRAKFLGAAGISLVMAPIASHGRTLPTDPIGFATAFVHETGVGLAIALALGVLAAAIQSGGQLLDTLSGFSMGALLDPVTGTQSAVLGQVYSLFSTMVFLLSGGVGLMVAGVARSYSLVPLGGFPSTGNLAALALQGLEQVPLIGLELAAPVLLALIVTDLVLGLLARSVPQLNAFMLGLPAKVMLAFGITAAALPFLVPHLEDDLAQQLSTALTALHP